MGDGQGACGGHGRRGDDLRARTRAFALRAIALTQSLPADQPADVIGQQLLRSSTSVGANYRAACRARSTREFIAKMGIVEEEADESAYWIELLGDAKLIRADRLEDLLCEANAIVAIAVSSIRTARKRLE